MFLLSDCSLFFTSTVTMVLFLVGISVAVNNSSHENQTAGNCAVTEEQLYRIPPYSKHQMLKFDYRTFER